MNEVAVILGDQLFAGLPGLPKGIPIFMREDAQFARNYRHHQQKLVLFFSAMRHFAQDYREAHGEEAVSYHAFDANQTESFTDSLDTYCRRHAIQRVHIYQPSDPGVNIVPSWLEVVTHPSPMFLTSPENWQAYTRTSKRRLMGDFYIQQRKRLGILLDEEGKPLGGKWSFDEDNRKALPRNVLPPSIDFTPPDAMTKEVIEMIRREFSDHPGDARDFTYPVTHVDAQAWLDQFLRERLDRFGDYEDAIPQRERTLFHSLLTPFLNTGLLTPAQVVSQTLKLEVPINSKEGFLRQIIGWREFIYGMSREYPEPPNGFGHTRKMRPCWYDGTTGLPPVDLAIRRVNAHAYCHHIERLMVLGSVMLMVELDPQEVYRWFMEMFLDSADWVMLPNVYGMSQFADGGKFATKPYICGSSYILKMSDWSKGPWCEVWDGLYWQFIDRHRELFARNPRMSAMVGTLDCMDVGRKERIFVAAENFRETTTY